MCGINCIYDPSAVMKNKRGVVGYMNDQMIYRGPDDTGVYADDMVALGMRRLSIIDIEGGHQPLVNEEDNLVLVCNGEIYNFVELRHELKARGHRFSSDSDVETILHLYEEKAEACLDDLRGMFAFIIWDKVKKKLFAARDRVGIKPLYFAELNRTIWFSSELRTIICAANINPTLRSSAVYQYLLYGYAIDQRHTVVEEVNRILPGEYIVIEKTETNHRRYWIPQFGGDEGIEDLPDSQIRGTLEKAVRLHLRSDVPIGILLSSGIDSSSLATFAALSGDNYTVLCAGYSGDHAGDESAQAQETATLLGLDYDRIILDSDSFDEGFDQVTKFCDEPTGDPSAMPQWELYKRAKQKGYKVLLSGIGGDEVFFGYPKWNIFGELSKHLSLDEYETWIGFDEDRNYIEVSQIIDSIGGDGFKAIGKGINAPLYELRDQAPPGPDAMNAMLFGTYLVHNGCLLSDTLGMGCSVEVRVPFLDHVLVQSVNNLPLNRRFEIPNSKPLLKRLMLGYLPEEVLEGEKKGFTPPEKYIDQLIIRKIDKIYDGILAKTGWIELSKLRRLCSRHSKASLIPYHRVRRLLGIPKIPTFLYRLLAFEGWYNEVISSRQSGIP